MGSADGKDAIEVFMKTQMTLFLVLFLIGCSDTGSGGTEEPATDEPPFFTADKHATGPLSLAELNIRLPDEIAKALSDSERSCFFEAVERRANEAGDPADLDPNAFPYWGGKVSRDEWGQHSNHMRRVLLAQGIVSWAMIDC